MYVKVYIYCDEQETALTQINEGRLLDLKLLLDREFLAPLQPLLLLLGWDRYRDVGSGQKLLDCLWPRGPRKEVRCHVHLPVCVCFKYHESYSKAFIFLTLFGIGHSTVISDCLVEKIFSFLEQCPKIIYVNIFVQE